MQRNMISIKLPFCLSLWSMKWSMISIKPAVHFIHWSIKFI
jgi:hypothetical protein